MGFWFRKKLISSSHSPFHFSFQINGYSSFQPSTLKSKVNDGFVILYSLVILLYLIDRFESEDDKRRLWLLWAEVFKKFLENWASMNVWFLDLMKCRHYAHFHKRTKLFLVAKNRIFTDVSKSRKATSILSQFYLHK